MTTKLVSTLVSHFCKYEVISCSFALHFPNDYWCWASFHVLIGLLYIFFGETSIQILCLFFYWVVLRIQLHYFACRYLVVSAPFVENTLHVLAPCRKLIDSKYEGVSLDSIPLLYISLLLGQYHSVLITKLCSKLWNWEE